MFACHLTWLEFSGEGSSMLGIQVYGRYEYIWIILSIELRNHVVFRDKQSIMNNRTSLCENIVYICTTAADA